MVDVINLILCLLNDSLYPLDDLLLLGLLVLPEVSGLLEPVLDIVAYPLVHLNDLLALLYVLLVNALPYLQLVLRSHSPYIVKHDFLVNNQ